LSVKDAEYTHFAKLEHVKRPTLSMESKQDRADSNRR